MWTAADGLGWPFRDVVRPLMLTGQRRDEVGRMRWSEVDLVAAMWTIPKDRANNGQAHIVPLSAPAVAMVHDAAARALKGAADPGMLQLDFLHPNGGNMHSTRFPIGAVDAMADTAISAAANGPNVYIEGRTVDVRASAGRGKANATRGVFAFVNDSDGDKGKAGALPIAPTWSVESSPGDRHDWIVLDRALMADEAEPPGRSLRKLIGSGRATAKLTQPYRVAGTPSLPSKAKVARGRVTSPTRILSADGPLWSAAQLAEVALPVEEPDADAGASSAGRSGATSGTFDELIAEAGPDRSERFFDAVRAAFRAGMLRGDVEDAMKLAETAGKVGRVAPVWAAARELLRAEDEAAVSGRLVLAEVTREDGFGRTRVVRTHGVQKVLEGWLDVPMLLLDATLPSLDVLRASFPDVEVAAEVEATAPHARVRQVLGAPVSAGKLMGSKAGRNREAVRRAVLHRFVQAGRPSTLVVLQKVAAEWLRTIKLPASITVGHYGALAGLDGFKGVGLLIAVGRTMPSVTEAETYAGAVTGFDPLRTAEPAK